LGKGTDGRELWEYFERYGTVVDAVVIKDPVAKVSRGFGFVEFDGEIPKGLLERGHFIRSRKVGVREYSSPSS
jgi:RNA-binding protein Musashi